MAIPSIQHNTPSAGHISWGAFTIQLNGVSYGVPAASSSQRWVWWEYRNGTPILNSGPDVPSTLVDDDLVLFANKNGIGVRVQSTNFVDGELLVDGSIFSDALSTNLINSQHIVTAGLDAGVIKFGSMHGDRIAVNTLVGDRVLANSIGVDKLMVASMDNLLSDPAFEIPYLGASYAWSEAPEISIAVGSGYSGGNALQMTNTLEVQQTGNYPLDVPVEGGSSFRLVGRVLQTGSDIPEGGARILVSWKNAAGVSTGIYASIPATLADTWQAFAGIVTLPEEAVSYSVYLRSETTNATGTLFWDYVQMTRAANSKLIVDGSISTIHLSADAITSDMLVANDALIGALEAVDLSAVNLEAVNIVGGKIVVGDITIDPETGITIPTEDGVIHFPSDGSAAKFSGTIQTNDIQIENHLSLNGAQNAINGDLRLANVVEAPSTPITSEEFVFPDTTTLSSNKAWGLTESPAGDRWATVDFSAWNILEYSKTTGQLLKTIEKPLNGGSTGWYYKGVIDDPGSIDYFALAQWWEGSTGSWGDWHIIKVRSDGTTGNSFKISGPGTPSKRPGIGTKGDNLLVAWTRSSDQVVVITEYTRDGIQVSKTDLPYDGQAHDISAILHRPTGANGTGEFWLGIAGGMLYRMPDTATSVDTIYSLYKPEIVKGIHIPKNGTLPFHSLGWSTYKIYEWGGQRYSTSWPGTLRSRGYADFAYSIFDSDPAGTGQHETMISPVKNIGVPDYSRLKITVPPPADSGDPDSPDSFRIYADNILQTTSTPGLTSVTLSSLTKTGSAPQTSNGFVNASANPGSIHSSAADSDGSIISLLGDGSGRVGPLVWTATGRIKKFGSPEDGILARHKNVNQNLIDASYTAITWPDSRVTDTNVYSVSGASITLLETGSYLVIVSIEYDTDPSTALRFARVTQNGSTLKRFQTSSSGSAEQVGGSLTVSAIAGDVLEISGFLNSTNAAPIILGNTNRGTTLDIIRMR